MLPVRFVCMEPWRPWDADDDEYAERLIVRDLIPAPLRPALRNWLRDALNSGYSRASEGAVNLIQSALRMNFGFEAGPVDLDLLLSSMESRGDRFIMRVVDFLLSLRSPVEWSNRDEVDGLEWHLDQNMAAVTIEVSGDGYRITRRLPEGVEEAAQTAAESANSRAGRHLVKAWSEARSLTPDTSAVMTEAIRAVEAAAGPVVIPRDKQQRLGKIVAVLKDNSSWTLILPTRDDGYPNQRTVLIGMLEVLAFAEQQRHAGEEPRPEVAMAHVQLAATLVGWFSAGVVVKAE